MLKVVAFTALLAVVRASNLAAEWAAPLAVPVVKAYAAAPVLKTTILEHQHRPQYAYSYGVQDSLTGDFKEQYESRDGDLVRGSYSLVEADGSKRIVDYHADALSGFNAVVRKELPLAAPVAKIAAPVLNKIAQPILPAQAPVVTKFAQPIVPTVAKFSAPILPTLTKFAAPILPQASLFQQAPLLTKVSAPIVSQYSLSAPFISNYAASYGSPLVSASIFPQAPLISKTVAPLFSNYAAPFLSQTLPSPALTNYAASFLSSNDYAQLAAKTAPAPALPASREPVRFSSPVATIQAPADYQVKMARPTARSQAPLAENPLANLDLPLDASLAGLGLEENQWAAPVPKQW